MNRLTYKVLKELNPTKTFLEVTESTNLREIPASTDFWEEDGEYVTKTLFRNAQMMDLKLDKGDKIAVDTFAHENGLTIYIFHNGWWFTSALTEREVMLDRNSTNNTLRSHQMRKLLKEVTNLEIIDNELFKKL